MIAYRHNIAALAFVPRPRRRKPILTLRSRPVERRRRRTDMPHGDALPAFDLLKRIEALLLWHDIPPAKFGKEVLSDPNLVFNLRQGRRIREGTRARIVAYLDRMEGRRANGE